MLSPSHLQGLYDLQLPDYEPLFRFEEMRVMKYYNSGIVYALCDDKGLIFYFGYTTNPNARFDSRKHYPSCQRIRMRMKELGDSLRVCVVASGIKKEFEKLSKLERDLITYHSSALLLNVPYNYMVVNMKDKEYSRYRDAA